MYFCDFQSFTIHNSILDLLRLRDKFEKKQKLKTL